MKGYKNAIFGLVLIALGVFGFKEIALLPQMGQQSMVTGLGPAFFPRILLYLLTISGGLFIFAGLYSIVKNKEKINLSGFKSNIKVYLNVILFLISVFLYTRLLPLLGFLLSTFLFLVLWTIWFYPIFRDAENYKGITTKVGLYLAAISLVLTVIIYSLFFFVARVPLPGGIWRLM